MDQYTINTRPPKKEKKNSAETRHHFFPFCGEESTIYSLNSRGFATNLLNLKRGVGLLGAAGPVFMGTSRAVFAARRRSGEAARRRDGCGCST